MRKWRPARRVDGGTGPCRSEHWAGGRSAVRSERLDDCKYHDSDHENGRYFVDNPIEFLRAAIAVSSEVAHAAHKKAVHGGKHDDQKDLGVQPTGGIGAARPREP